MNINEKVMKKLFALCLIAFLAMSSKAQRIAVMEFKASVGISQEDVNGLSSIFATYFRPTGYTIVERVQIDRIIKEQSLQRNSLTESQMVHIGELLNLSHIVIGNINIVMGEYNVDVRIVNVESGTIVATEGATFRESYREGMKNLAQKLASQIAINPNPNIEGNTSDSPTSKTRTRVETLYGYLHVFPNELGVFQSQPTNLIANINAQDMYWYNDWRLPTNEELSLLRANGYLSDAEYMTKEKENVSGMVLLVTTGKPIVAHYYIGDYYKDDNKEGIVVNVWENGRHGWIMSLNEMKSDDWTNISYDKSLTTSYEDGVANTILIKNRSNFKEEFPSVAWVCSLGEQWYLPAAEELRVIMNKKDEINKSLFKLGKPQIQDDNYISSHVKPGSSSRYGPIDKYYHYYVRGSNGEVWSGAGNYRVRAIATF